MFISMLFMNLTRNKYKPKHNPMLGWKYLTLHGPFSGKLEIDQSGVCSDQSSYPVAPYSAGLYDCPVCSDPFACLVMAEILGR